MSLAGQVCYLNIKCLSKSRFITLCYFLSDRIWTDQVMNSQRSSSAVRAESVRILTVLE